MTAQHVAHGDLGACLGIHARQRELDVSHVVELGLDRSRTKRRNLHRASLPPQFLTDGLGQAQHIALGRVVGRHERSGHKSGR